MDASPESERTQILARARLLALDVDGVLTDGRVIYAGPHEVQVFHASDGQGLAWLVDAGVQLTWITGRGCEPTKRRARELRVAELLTGIRDKQSALAEVQARLDVSPEETIAMGDDVPDLGLAARAALFVAPADARAEVREQAGWVTQARGGRGAVRELAEAILVAQGAWPPAPDGSKGRA